MKKALPTILIGCLFILVLDILGSIASRQMNFNYARLMPFSFLIYAAIPFVIAKNVDQKIAIVSGAFLGVFDATIGWKLSLLLRANTGNEVLIVTPIVLIVTTFFMAIIGALFGLAGSWLGLKFPLKKEK